MRAVAIIYLPLDEALGRGRPLVQAENSTEDATRTNPQTQSQCDHVPGICGITEREVEVLRLIGQGRSNRQIARELVLSVRTVERHITNVYWKIGAHSRVDAVLFALEHGLVKRPYADVGP